MTTPAVAASSPKANGRFASNLAGITLLVGALIAAFGIYFDNWDGSTLLFVFVLGFLAYAIGLMIEKRRAPSQA
jgi:uncharacterized membrane protein